MNPDQGPDLSSLYQRTATGVKLGLETTRRLLARMADPQQVYPCIHVAGTNGKGSVCAMIASVLQAAGCRTGLYTSPHLVRFNERIRVDGRVITDAELAGLLAEVDLQDQAQSHEAGARLATFFEFTTVLALEYFRRQRVEVVVLETGLGGRLDATNVVTPLLSIITPVGLEHTAYLGDTLSAVAAEKAGIIKPNCPVICAAQEDAAMEVLIRTARERRAPLIQASSLVSVQRRKNDWSGQTIKIETESASYPPIRLPLLGRHQLDNTATAVAALQCLQDAGCFSIDDQALKKGLEAVAWPARLQVLEQDPPIVLDAAHNPHAAGRLVESLEELAGKRPLALIAGLLADKDAKGFFQAFGHRIRKTWLVSVKCDRAMPMDRMLADAASIGMEAQPGNLPDVLAEARAWARREKGVVCIAGSLYLAGEVLALIGWKEASHENH